MITQTEQEPEAPRKAGNAEALAGYRETLKNLARAIETTATHLEKTAGLEQKLTELQSEYATLLDTDDESDSLKKESTLATTIRVLEAKLSRAKERQTQAQAGCQSQTDAARGHFQRLHLIFKLWVAKREKDKLREHLIASCPEFPIDQVVMHLRSVAELASLEVTASDPSTVIAQAEKLLTRIEGEAAFEVPPPAGSSPRAHLPPPKPETEWTGPWDPMDGSVNIQAEINKLFAEDPTLTPASVQERLRANFPHLYKTQAELLEMQKPLDGLVTGAYEQDNDTGKLKLLVTPIGSTTT